MDEREPYYTRDAQAFMDDRDFEEWAIKEGFAYRDHNGIWPVGGNRLRPMLDAWKAARRTTPDREAIIEECAKVCDEYAADQWSLYKGRAPYNGNEAGRADPDVQGRSDGADVCAERIRALKTAPTNDKGGA
ncbi:hypothetical protein BDI4_600037 [Burkholderia diffusa]|uniref:hypothetical protein n=1 Tax=Burkholderia diffusa TaxID=488732 RepID=UPI001CAB8F33|nr:hypothetical protein [Burkholderia diffusa]CAG9259492.1 hypothetical protein BDI4_600037 [Burkholderia diffusa]